MMKWCIVLLGGLAIVHGQTAPTINADGESITVDATDLVRAAHFATKRNLGFYPTSTRVSCFHRTGCMCTALNGLMVALVVRHKLEPPLASLAHLPSLFSPNH